MQRSRIVVLSVLAAALAAVILARPFAQAKDEEPKVDKAALERTRKTVRMLDDVYKTGIVLITDKYVHDRKDFAAGSAAVLLFKNISEAGPNKVRLIDASGAPYNSKNVANDDFEKEGIKRLQAGAPGYEQVVRVDGKDHLRAMTPVPVVMKKCVMCHDNYKLAKEGEPIGVLGYTIPIE